MTPNTEWELEYNPDAFLPSSLDKLFLTGYFPMLKWLSDVSDCDVNICYIIGCGRSGTTLMAKILSAHPQVVVLNEPRLFWRERFDIWSVEAEERGGVLQADTIGDEIMNDYRQVATATQKPWIVEKFPEHCFKLTALHTLWQKQKGRAVFVYAKREPRAVAKSISAFSFPAWYGACGYKWKCLRSLCDARMLNFIEHLEPQLSMFARGCVEYCASVREIQQSGVPIVVMDYEGLLSDPQRAVEAFKFLPEPGFDRVTARALELVRPSSNIALSTEEEDIIRRLKSLGGIYNALI